MTVKRGEDVREDVETYNVEFVTDLDPGMMRWYPKSHAFRTRVKIDVSFTYGAEEAAREFEQKVRELLKRTASE
jgi:hypothetical protein